jgi:hypothetical protein
MPSRTEIVSLYLEAQSTRDEAKLNAIEALIADDIVMGSPMGSTQGKEKIMSRMRKGGSGPMAQMQASLVWSTPVEAGGTVTTSAELPPGLPLPMPIKGLDMKFSFTEDNRISKVDFSPRM